MQGEVAVGPRCLGAGDAQAVRGSGVVSRPHQQMMVQRALCSLQAATHQAAQGHCVMCSAVDAASLGNPALELLFHVAALVGAGAVVLPPVVPRRQEAVATRVRHLARPRGDRRNRQIRHFRQNGPKCETLAKPEARHFRQNRPLHSPKPRRAPRQNRQIRQNRRFRHKTRALGGAEGFTYAVVTDVERWKCVRVRCVGLGAGVPADREPRLQLLCEGVSQPLLRFAAATGFRSLGLTHLRMLFRHLGLQEHMEEPKAEAALVGALCKHADPTLEPDALDKLLAQRVGEPFGLEEALVSDTTEIEEDMQLVADELGPGAAEEWHLLREATARRDEARQQRLQHLRLQAAQMPQATGMDEKPRHKALPLRAERGLTQLEAKELLPPGFNISKEMEWHHRWRARSKRLNATYSKAFGDGPDADNAALQEVLSLCWLRHAEASPQEACPWRLDRGLFA